MNYELKELRENAGLTQEQAALLLGVSLRSYKDYENKMEKKDSLKYNAFRTILYEKYKIDEEHGVLKIEDIRLIVSDVLSAHSIKYCYLFGSYAKGYAKEDSDVDLLIAGDIEGIQFFGLIEELRIALHKKVDLLDTYQLLKNPELLEEILKDGVKIYG